MPDQTEEFKFKPVLPGSPELEALVASGYNGLTVIEAKEIVAARKKDPQSFPYAEQQRAEAVIAANTTKAKVVSKRPMFKRKVVSE